MTRKDLQKLSQLRLKEARLLLKNGHYQGAYYLSGYSLECALKAVIAKQINRHQFPDKDLATKAFSHGIEDLMKLSGLSIQFQASLSQSPALSTNWLTAKDWNVRSRYDLQTSKVAAEDMYSAVASRSGILAWIKKKW